MAGAYQNRLSKARIIVPGVGLVIVLLVLISQQHLKTPGQETPQHSNLVEFPYRQPPFVAEEGSRLDSPIKTVDHVGEMFLYSAFWDDRPSVEGGPVVRVLAIMQVLPETGQPGAIGCKVLCKSSRTQMSSIHVDEAKQVFQMHKNTWPIINRRRDPSAWYGAFVVTCLPGACTADDRDHFVTLLRRKGSRDEAPTTTEAFLHVQFPKKTRFPSNFVNCQHPVFGHPLPPARIVEWVEMQKLLGVSKIVFYNESMDDSTATVLEHYRDQGLVEIHQAKTIKNEEIHYKPEFHLRQRVVFTDCMYRNMYQYRYLVTSDMDEVIVPRNVSSYMSMMELVKRVSARSLGKNLKVACHKFWMAFFLPQSNTGVKSDLEHPNGLYFLQNIYRNVLPQKSSSPGHPKHITDLMGCVALNQHSCFLATDTFNRKSFVVDSRIGIVHHYRSEPVWRFYINETIRDDRMLDFAEQLTRNVEMQLKTLVLV